MVKSYEVQEPYQSEREKYYSISLKQAKMIVVNKFLAVVD